MTVSSDVSQIEYTGDGATVAFPIPFYFIENGDVAVYLKRASTDEVAQLVLGASYTLTGAGDEAGGTATLDTAPLAGDQLLVRRELTIVQETDYPPNSIFPAASQERALDRGTMVDQQLANLIARALVSPPLSDYYDAHGKRIINLGDPVSDRDAVNQRTLLQAIGDFEQMGLNTAPKFWELTGDGTTKQFYLPGADIDAETFYDVYVAGVGIEPQDGFTIAAESDTDNSHINFTTAPANAAECWVVLRGYAKPAGFDLLSNQTFIDLVHSIVQSILDQTVVTLGAVQSLLPQANANSSGSIDKTRQSYLLRGTSPTAITLTIRANSGDTDLDWSEDAGTACYFSVLQRGDGAITVAGDPGVTILVPSGYLPKPRAKGSTITLTGDNVTAGQWVCSGDMALDLT